MKGVFSAAPAQDLPRLSRSSLEDLAGPEGAGEQTIQSPLPPFRARVKILVSVSSASLTRRGLLRGRGRAILASLMAALRSVGLLFLAACGGGAGASGDATPAKGTDSPTGATTVVNPPPAKPAEIALPPSGQRIGAIPYEGGVEFRVWAPNVASASVILEGQKTALPAEPGGTFGTKIPGAHAGQKYRFLIGDQERQDPRARQTDGVDAIIVDPRAYAWKSTFTPPAREKTVVYELHVGAFTDGGTFASAETKLDALVDLGVNAIELMPVNQHGKHGWGYGPQGYFAVHPEFGTADDFRHFVDAAHGKGIAVIADIVFNHYDGASSAPLRCFDGPCPGVYFFDDKAYQMTPWGPRPAFSKKEVSDFLADAIFAWTTEYQLDGFRHDSVSNIRALDGQGTVPGGTELLVRLNDVATKARPGSLAIAEDLKGFAGITASVESGGLGFATQWDGGFQWSVDAAVTSTTPDLNAVSGTITSTYNGDPFQRLLYIESHDTAGNDGNRLPVKIDAADATGSVASRRALLAAGILFTTPGVPMLFMGQEMRDTTKFLPSPSPLDWSGYGGSFYSFYKDLVHLRRSSAALVGSGVTVTHLNTSAGSSVIAYRRTSGSDDVMVLANFGSKKYTRYDIGVPSGGAWKVIDAADTKYGGDGATTVTVTTATRDGLPSTASVALDAYDIVVLTR